MDPYEVLGIDRNSSLENARRAYRARAKVRHPDRGGSTEEMRVLNAAMARVEAMLGAFPAEWTWEWHPYSASAPAVVREFVYVPPEPAPVPERRRSAFGILTTGVIHVLSAVPVLTMALGSMFVLTTLIVPSFGVLLVTWIGTIAAVAAVVCGLVDIARG